MFWRETQAIRKKKEFGVGVKKLGLLQALMEDFWGKKKKRRREKWGKNVKEKKEKGKRGVDFSIG